MDTELLFGLLRMFLVLALLVPAIYYSTKWLAKRQRSGTSIQLKETVPLGTNRALAIVEWESKRYLIGFTNHNIVVLDVVNATTQSQDGEDES